MANIKNNKTIKNNKNNRKKKRYKSIVDEIFEKTKGEICVETKNINACSIIGTFLNLATKEDILNMACEPYHYFKEYSVHAIIDLIFTKYPEILGIRKAEFYRNIDRIENIIINHIYINPEIELTPEYFSILKKELGKQIIEKICILYNFIKNNLKEYTESAWTTLGGKIYSSEYPARYCISLYQLKSELDKYREEHKKEVIE